MTDAQLRTPHDMLFHHDAWAVTLDRIELDLMRAEHALASGEVPEPIEEWHVPDHYGPIPTTLRPRAEEILGRQRLALQALAQKLGVNAQHRALVEDVARVSTRASELAVYVDVDA